MLLYNYFSSLQSKYHGVRQNWLDQYQSTVKASTENTKAKQALLYKSLGISRELANRPAIAATLTQSADIDAVTENFSNAEDKYLRALFIRHQLGDVKNTLLILQQLQTVYNSTENDRKKQTTYWIDRISQNDLSNWNQLYSDFETYPVIK